MKHLSTSKIAKDVGVHPNTVRLYEVYGLLQPVPRNEKGYRLYSAKHLEQMRLARIALSCDFCAANIRKMATSIVKAAACGCMQDALTEAEDYLKHIRNELIEAEEALKLIQRWANGELDEKTGKFFKRNDVASFLGVSIDVLRNWERNGLIEIPRNPENGYRVYGSAEINRLKVIRTLRAADYSMMAILRMMHHIDSGKKEAIRSVIDTTDKNEDMKYATDRWIATLRRTEQSALKVIVKLKQMIENKY